MAVRKNEYKIAKKKPKEESGIGKGKDPSDKVELSPRTQPGRKVDLRGYASKPGKGTPVEVKKTGRTLVEETGPFGKRVRELRPGEKPTGKTYTEHDLYPKKRSEYEDRTLAHTPAQKAEKEAEQKTVASNRRSNAAQRGHERKTEAKKVKAGKKGEALSKRRGSNAGTAKHRDLHEQAELEAATHHHIVEGGERYHARYMKPEVQDMIRVLPNHIQEHVHNVMGYQLHEKAERENRKPYLTAAKNAKDKMKYIAHDYHPKDGEYVQTKTARKPIWSPTVGDVHTEVNSHGALWPTRAAGVRFQKKRSLPGQTNVKALKEDQEKLDHDVDLKKAKEDAATALAKAVATHGRAKARAKTPEDLKKVNAKHKPIIASLREHKNSLRDIESPDELNSAQQHYRELIKGKTKKEQAQNEDIRSAGVYNSRAVRRAKGKGKTVSKKDSERVADFSDYLKAHIHKNAAEIKRLENKYPKSKDFTRQAVLDRFKGVNPGMRNQTGEYPKKERAMRMSNADAEKALEHAHNIHRASYHTEKLREIDAKRGSLSSPLGKRKVFEGKTVKPDDKTFEEAKKKSGYLGGQEKLLDKRREFHQGKHDHYAKLVDEYNKKRGELDRKFKPGDELEEKPTGIGRKVRKKWATKRTSKKTRRRKT